MKKNQSIRNEKTGETLTMLISEEDNGGTRQLYRVCLPRHRPSPPLHYHLAFSETFTVIEGSLAMYLGRDHRKVRLSRGESVTAAIGEPYTFANDSAHECVIAVETQPAGGVVKAFQLAYAIANLGGAARDGLPKNPVIRLRFIQIGQGFLPSMPLMFQICLFRIAAMISRMTGIERRLQQYFAD
jgi:mannose-6-phosphate isomerase-like protein (cupin superfamily)